MNERAVLLLKNIGLLTIGNFTSKFLVFLLVPLYTSVLSTQEYGIYDLAVSTAAVAFPVLTLNISDAVMRFCMDREWENGAVVAVGLRHILRGILLGGVVAVFVHFMRIPWPIRGLEWYVFFYFAFYAANQFLIQLAKGMEAVRDMAIAGVTGAAVMLSTNVVFLLFARWGLMGFFVANGLAQAVPAVYLAIRLKLWAYIPQNSFDSRISREMRRYCIPLIFTVLGWWINSAADKYVVALVCGLAANGILSVAYKIPGIINIFQGIFTQAWQISAIKAYGESDAAQFYGDAFTAMNTLMCAVCSWLIFLSRPLAGLLYAKDFYYAWQYVPFLLISSVLNCASGFIGPILSAKRDSRSMALSAVYGSAMNVVLNILFVHLFGIQGATVATAISSYVIFYVRKRAAKSELRVDGYWRVLLTWGLLVLQAIVEIRFSSYFAQIVIMAVLLLINGKTLLRLCRHLSGGKTKG